MLPSVVVTESNITILAVACQQAFLSADRENFLAAILAPDHPE